MRSLTRPVLPGELSDGSSVARTHGGERYVVNATSGEVHDLDNEDTSWNGCEVDAIITAGHNRPCHSLEKAYRVGTSAVPGTQGGGQRPVAETGSCKSCA